MTIINKATEAIGSALVLTRPTFSSEEVTEFIDVYLPSVNPMVVINHHNLPSLTEHIFSTQEIRDFMLAVTFRFWLSFGASQPDRTALISALTGAVTLHQGSLSETSTSATPIQVTERLLTYSEAETILNGNKWIVVFLLLVFIAGAGNEKRTRNQ